jgi:OOP family OmpA-OmpF porin
MKRPRPPHVSAKRLAGVIALAAFGLPLTGYASSSPGYLHDRIGQIVTDGYGGCVHVTGWKPSDAVPGCDGVPKRSNLSAMETPAPAMPAPQPQPQAQPNAMKTPAPPPKPQKITLNTDTLFAFNKAKLRPEARQKLNQIVRKLKRYPSVADITITGYTDRIGTKAYNQGLSERRAHAVAAYLRAHTDVNRAKFQVVGKGEQDPVVACHGTGSSRALIKCLQPNRRAEVDIKAREVARAR